MKPVIIFVSAVLLSGCMVTPVERNFPNIPPSLEAPCRDLLLTEPTERLSQVLKVVAENYSRYYECQAQVDAWQSWYTQQKQIFGSVDQ